MERPFSLKAMVSLPSPPTTLLMLRTLWLEKRIVSSALPPVTVLPKPAAPVLRLASRVMPVVKPEASRVSLPVPVTAVRMPAS